MSRTLVRLLIVVGLLVTFVTPAFAQDECPAGYVTLYVNPDAGVDDPAIGTMEQPLKTPEKAIELLGTGNGCVVVIDAAGQQVSLLVVEPAAEVEAAAEAPAEAAAEAPAEAAAEAAAVEDATEDTEEPEVPDTGVALPSFALNLLLVGFAAGLVLAGVFVRRRAGDRW
jgi:hypothetical protein